MADRETLDVYKVRAEDYACNFVYDAPGANLLAFMKALPKGGRVLDLGCGPGYALTHMVQAGFDAEGLEPVEEFAAMAEERSGAPVMRGTFDDIPSKPTYDGVYANFSLLHAPKAELPRHLSRIAAALTPGGVFHLGTKTGTGERRDKIGRFYAYYTDEELSGLLVDAGFIVEARDTGEEAGLDGTVAPWIVLLVRKTT